MQAKPNFIVSLSDASAGLSQVGGKGASLSHSSIVAREYGIPAVMATGVATRRIQNGQMLNDFLQEFYEKLGDIVVEHQGELVKYLGDGFLCVFPIGLEQEAVASAMAMREVFSEMERCV